MYAAVPGDQVVQEMQDDMSLTGQLSRTICGVLRARVHTVPIDAQDFLVPIYDDNHNSQIPRNLLLLCGDNHLDTMVPTLNNRAYTTPDYGPHPYVIVHNYLRDYIRSLAKYFKTQNKELVVFIDTNPAMTIYTQIALCAMTDLIVPLNADDYSLQVSVHKTTCSPRNCNSK